MIIFLSNFVDERRRMPKDRAIMSVGKANNICDMLSAPICIRFSNSLGASLEQYARH